MRQAFEQLQIGAPPAPHNLLEKFDGSRFKF
jgi:hypothetical protein